MICLPIFIPWKPPDTVWNPNLEPGTLLKNPVLFNGYSGYCQNFSSQEETHTGILPNTPFKKFLLLPGFNPNTIVFKNQRETFIRNAGMYQPNQEPKLKNRKLWNATGLWGSRTKVL